MRHVETLPAWAARQRSRRLVRRGDEKVVRWISHNALAKDGVCASTQSSDASSNDNVVSFTSSRSA